MGAWEGTMTLRIGKRSKRGAFTLIELILVMALLVVVVAVTFPSLQGFFKGRTLEAEGRRFLTLTRYAQSRAVSEGIPMTLWIDPKKGLYGLEARTGYLESDEKAVEYEVDEKLEIVVEREGLSRAQLTPEQQVRRSRQPVTRNSNAEIHFAPDGSIDVESPVSVSIREERNNESALWISQSANRLGYEVRQTADDETR
jgi:prepilin-type N-terminal cleavage/methylation domain-containing protein